LSDVYAEAKYIESRSVESNGGAVVSTYGPRSRRSASARASDTHSASCAVQSVKGNKQTNKQIVYWILAASKGWIKQTYRKIMHTQNHISLEMI